MPGLLQWLQAKWESHYNFKVYDPVNVPYGLAAHLVRALLMAMQGTGIEALLRALAGEIQPQDVLL